MQGRNRRRIPNRCMFFEGKREGERRLCPPLPGLSCFLVILKLAWLCMSCLLFNGLPWRGGNVFSLPISASCPVITVPQEQHRTNQRRSRKVKRGSFLSPPPSQAVLLLSHLSKHLKKERNTLQNSAREAPTHPHMGENRDISRSL